jgi:xylulokinase
MTDASDAAGINFRVVIKKIDLLKQRCYLNISGTLWLDVKRREWSDSMLEATGLNRNQMPEVREGSTVAGHLFYYLSKRWNLQSNIPIAAGGSDNAAGAVGVGIVQNGQAMLSIGTSGVYFSVSDGFKSNPNQTVHSFCHCLPGKWHLMSVMLNSANCLDFTARITGFQDVSALLEAAKERGLQPNGPLFLPYLTGERTPHNDSNLRGSFTSNF